MVSVIMLGLRMQPRLAEPIRVIAGETVRFRSGTSFERGRHGVGWLQGWTAGASGVPWGLAGGA
jgi:hypothetical protein